MSCCTQHNGLNFFLRDTFNIVEKFEKKFLKPHFCKSNSSLRKYFNPLCNLSYHQRLCSAAVPHHVRKFEKTSFKSLQMWGWFFRDSAASPAIQLLTGSSISTRVLSHILTGCTCLKRSVIANYVTYFEYFLCILKMFIPTSY